MSGGAAGEELEQLHRARVCGMLPSEAAGELAPLIEASLVVATERGCMLTPEGFERHGELLAGWREGADLEQLEKGYRMFLGVNDAVKRSCAEWQAAGGDAEALFLAVGVLEDAVEQAAPGLGRAAGVAPRFADYEPRLRRALEAAAGGDGAYLTDPGVDSFHNVWFECHEDFLTTLGISREEEGSY